MTTWKQTMVQQIPKNWSPEIPAQHVSSSHFTTGSQPIQHFFSQTHSVHTHVHSHCYPTRYPTHHHINTTSSSPRWSSFSSTYLLPYPFQTLLLTNPRLLEWQQKDLNRNYFVQFCQLCWEEWHEALRSAWTTSPGPDATVITYFSLSRTPPGRYIGMDDRQHELYFDWEKFGLNLVAQRIKVLGRASDVTVIWTNEVVLHMNRKVYTIENEWVPVQAKTSILV